MREAKLTRFRGLTPAWSAAQGSEASSRRTCGPTTMDLRTGQREGEAQVSRLPLC
jgi:hypothetical protein